ncbi:MAG TPA: GNAT family N-acetyltransferase [Rickettsiales bacterium]|nr:GNAT family N-acetyltransferase [Rickettsiales bacterium]
MASEAVTVRELKGLEEISIIFPLITQLNPDVDEAAFASRLKVMLKEGYRCIGAFQQGKLVGCTGFWIGTRMWCGAFIEPDNLVIDRDHRRQGIGEQLMAWVEQEGRRHNCQIVKLETYTVNEKARAFYAGQGYDEPGIVIVKPLMIDPETWRKNLESKAK